MEFVVRLDDGQTLSVVQPNEQNLRPGDRVTLQRGPRTRILRAS
jgi:outer membrane lipoprotein SlyB